jgi:hypothetical protein
MVSKLIIEAILVIYTDKNKVKGRLAAEYLNLIIKLIKVSEAEVMSKV